MFRYEIILAAIAGLAGIGLFITFVVAKARYTRYNPSYYPRSSTTPRLVYFFIPTVVAVVLAPIFLADLYWRTLDTGFTLSVVLLLSAGLGYLLVRWMKKSSLFAEVDGRNRIQCCVVLFVAVLIFPSLLLLVLNNAYLQSPPYIRTAVVTNKITGAAKGGTVTDYVAFEGSQVSEFGGVRVSPSLYGSVELGSNVVVYLENGCLGFPVVVGIAKS